MISKDFNSFKNSAGGKYVMYGLYVAIIVAIIIVVVNIYKGVKEAANAAGAAATDGIVASKLGLTGDRVAFIRTTAQNLWDKSTHRDFFKLFLGFSYDTDDFVVAVNQMTGTNEVVLLNQYYMQAGGHSLRAVITAMHGFGSLGGYAGDPSAGINSANWSTIQTL